MPKLNAPTAALIAYQDLEKALRKEGIWEVVEGLVQEVRDTAYLWGYDAGWDNCAAQHHLATD